MNKFFKIFVFICLAGVTGLLVIGGVIFYFERDRTSFLYRQIVVKGKAFSFVRASSEIEFDSGGLTLRGSLFRPRGSQPHPGIVLAHGGTVAGRKLALYKLLGHKLARRGYVVLSFDFRGYGESEDPAKFETPLDLDFIGDVQQAVSYLLSVKGVNTADIHLVGHSFGAGVIIPAGVRDTRISSMVAIAPGRRGHELMWSENAPAKHYPRERLAQDMDIPRLREAPIDFLNPILRYVTIDTILTHAEHPPLLLIDGEREDARDLRFLKELYDDTTAPKAYVTIRNADHYFGTLRDDQGIYSIVTYWDAIVEDLVDTIDKWIRNPIFNQEFNVP